MKIVDEYRYLGYTLDNKLKFKSQIRNVVNKLSSCNYILARAHNFIPKFYLSILFNSIGLTHILYNKFIFINLSSNQKKKIQLKLYHSGSIIHHCLLKHVSGKVFNFDYILKFYTYIALYKIFTKNYAPQLKHLMKEKTHNHNTRHKSQFFIEYSRCNTSDFNFSLFAAKLWNWLPLSIREIQNIGAFKIELERVLDETLLS